MFGFIQKAVFIEYDEAGRLKLTKTTANYFKLKLLTIGSNYNPLVETATQKEIGGIFVFEGLSPIVNSAIESQNSILGETVPMEVTV